MRVGVAKLREGLLWEQIDDEVIVLELDNSVYFRVNGTGAELWGLLERSATPEELAKVLVDNYELEPARAFADVEAFLKALEAARMIEL